MSLISIHTSREGCDHIGFYMKKEIQISIHTSRAGCDAPDFRSGRVYIKFQFTHPVRDVTARPSSVQADIPISIHTSRAGCDNVRTKIL